MRHSLLYVANRWRRRRALIVPFTNFVQHITRSRHRVNLMFFIISILSIPAPLRNLQLCDSWNREWYTYHGGLHVGVVISVHVMYVLEMVSFWLRRDVVQISRGINVNGSNPRLLLRFLDILHVQWWIVCFSSWNLRDESAMSLIFGYENVRSNKKAQSMFTLRDAFFCCKPLQSLKTALEYCMFLSPCPCTVAKLLAKTSKILLACQYLLVFPNFFLQK